MFSARCSRGSVTRKPAQHAGGVLRAPTSIAARGWGQDVSYCWRWVPHQDAGVQ